MTHHSRRHGATCKISALAVSPAKVATPVKAPHQAIAVLI